MRILFTGGGGAGSPALWELLGARYTLHFADSDARRIHPVVPRERAHAIPPAADPGYVAAILRLCRDEDIDLLVPGVDEELSQLARSSEALAPTWLMLPDASFVETALDKYSFARALAGLALPVPSTSLLSEWEGWDSFPCIVKPRSGRGSRGVLTVNSARELRSVVGTLEERAGQHVLQELMRGDEYTVQVVANRWGSLRAVLPARVLLKKGVTISAVTDGNESVVSACRTLHMRMPTSGCYNVQGILDGRGVFMPFEVNPRVSTTLCLAVAAGADPFALFLDDSPPPVGVDFENGVLLERFWENRFTRSTGENPYRSQGGVAGEM